MSLNYLRYYGNVSDLWDYGLEWDYTDFLLEQMGSVAILLDGQSNLASFGSGEINTLDFNTIIDLAKPDGVGNRNIKKIIRKL